MTCCRCHYWCRTKPLVFDFHGLTRAMNIYQSSITVVLFLAVVGDIGSLFTTLWGSASQDIVSTSSDFLLPFANAQSSLLKKTLAEAKNATVQTSTTKKPRWKFVRKGKHGKGHSGKHGHWRKRPIKLLKPWWNWNGTKIIEHRPRTKWNRTQINGTRPWSKNGWKGRGGGWRKWG